MRKLLISLVSVFALVLLVISCTNENESDLENSNATAELSFEVNLLGNPSEETKSLTTDPGKCATQQELINLASQNNLTLNVTIGATTYTPKIRWTGSKFIADPILLGAGSYSATAATVTNGANEVLFSAVASSSPYASYVPELLPKSFTVGGSGSDIPLYQKTSLDLYVMCVLKETPKEFGFVKWNIHFTKVYCVPFIINMCKDTEHFIASGSLNIKNGTYVNNVFTPATGTESPVKWAKIDKTVSFTSTSNPLADLCFADNYEINNDNEWYKLTLTITSPVSKTYIGYANVATLLKYNLLATNNAWDATNNVIHFNFCDNKTWFFTEDVPPVTSCEDNTMLDIFESINNIDTFKDFVQTKVSGGNFVDGFAGLTTSEVGINIPAGTKIRIKQSIKLTTGNMSYANIYYVPLNTSEEIAATVYKINIYTDYFTALYKSINCPYKLFGQDADPKLPGHWSIDAPTCFEGSTNCYYMEFEFTKSVKSVTKLLISTTQENTCPDQYTLFPM